MLARPWTLTLLAATTLACAAPSKEEIRPQSPRHVLFVTVDTLRGDHTSLLGYERPTTPFLEQLGRESVVYERAVVQWPKTGTSFASMFTGRYPQSSGLTHRAALRVPNELPILPELFQAAGFRTVAVVSNAVLSKDLGWDRGFDEYVETWGGKLADDPHAQREFLHAVRVNRLTEELLERHGDAERLFLWVHYSDPHTPYVLPEGRQNPFLGDALYEASSPASVDLSGNPAKAIGKERDLRFYRAQYDANVLEVDRAVASLAATFEDHGLWESAVTIFLADHGEGLGEHRLYFEHGANAYDPCARVPLLVRLPYGSTAQRVEQPTEIVGLPATLQALIPELQLPQEMLRESRAWAAVAAEEDASALAFAEAGRPSGRYHRAVHGARFKLVFREPREERPAESRDYELYDLAHDPGETKNVLEQHPAEARRLVGALRAWMALARTSAATGAEDEVAPEELEALRAMGYVQ